MRSWSLARAGLACRSRHALKRPRSPCLACDSRSTRRCNLVDLCFLHFRKLPGFLFLLQKQSRYRSLYIFGLSRFLFKIQKFRPFRIFKHDNRKVVQKRVRKPINVKMTIYHYIIHNFIRMVKYPQIELQRVRI